MIFHNTSTEEDMFSSLNGDKFKGDRLFDYRKKEKKFRSAFVEFVEQGEAKKKKIL